MEPDEKDVILAAFRNAIYTQIEKAYMQPARLKPKTIGDERVRDHGLIARYAFFATATQVDNIFFLFRLLIQNSSYRISKSRFP